MNRALWRLTFVAPAIFCGAFLFPGPASAATVASGNVTAAQASTCGGDVETNDTSATIIISDSGVVTWSVSAIFAGCPPLASQSLTFSLEKEDCSKHGSAVLTAPADRVTLPSSSVDFVWTKVEGADGYRLWIRVDGGTAQALGDTVDTTMHKDIAAGSIDWFVETLFEGCASTLSETRNFTVPRAVNCGTEVPVLTSPTDSVVFNASLIAFTWTAVPGAISYELYLSANGTPTLLGTTTATSLNREVPPAVDLEWFVRANVNGCPQRTSLSRGLRYDPPASCATGRTVLTAPGDDASAITSPLSMRWTLVPGVKSYVVWLVKGDAGNSSAAAQPQVIGRPTGTSLDNLTVGNGAWRWFVDAVFETGCPIRRSTDSRFVVVTQPSACTPLPQPRLSAPAQISSSGSFTIRWSSIPGASSYGLQEATQAGFGDAVSITTASTEATFQHPNPGNSPVAYLYRVRAIDNRCSPPEQSPFSAAAQVTILPAVTAPLNNQAAEGSTAIGESQAVTYSVSIGADHARENFSATPTRPWLTVTPPSGVVPDGGLTLTVTANTTGLPLGTSLGGITIAYSSQSGRLVTNAGGKTVPISISIVTPVAPTPKSGPGPDALIIPAIAHADGINSKFESDVRVTNTSPQVMKYQLTFTPSGTAGITEGSQTTIDIDPGRTIALDDVLRIWFATGTSNATGTLEIRPITQAANATSASAVKGLSNFVTFAASRTFNATDHGTFGQFIPAVPFANFVGGATGSSKAPILSMQQIAQSADYRTNLGLVEGSGQPVTLAVTVFGDHGEQLTTFPVDLNGGQHLQLSGFLSQRGIQVNDGRVEVAVTGGGGKVTAYASVLDNRTSDPLLVSPVTIGDSSSSRFVLPGVAQFTSGAGWQTDTRLFNAGDSAVKATLTFQSLTGAAPKTTELTVQPKQIMQIDRTLETLFGISNDGGAIGIVTDAPANLIATARTYRPDPSGGTVGQFIQAVTPDQAIQLGSRPLQILQVEESARFRSNIGVAEVSGKPVSVEVTAIPPDSKISSTIVVDLAPNQFTQIDSLLAKMGLSDTHNARVTVKVIDGPGSVTAYASVIDLQTQDPTFVPAQ